MGYLTRRPIDVSELIAAVSAPERGGIATFVGLVRDHHGGRAVRALEYTAYEPMAESICAEIVGEAEARWPVRIGLRHRLGALGIGDTAVAIAAAAGHRDEAFGACRYAIEELKRRVPIWKRETFADGSEEWVDPSRTAAPSSEEREGMAPW